MRVFAAFAVIVLHVAAQNWHKTDVNTFAWNVFNFYDGVVRLAVPIFVMISGALFLNRDIPFRKIFSKYILRIATAFLFWSCIYAIASYIKHRDTVQALHFITGGSHFWFLFMITGLYMILPFTKKIAESEFLTKYFLVLAFIFAFFFPQSVNVISVFAEEYGTRAQGVLGRFYMNFVMGFTAYFLLGYVLNRIEISEKFERMIYLAGFLGALSTVLATATVSIMKSEPIGIFHGNMTVNVLLESIAVFVFFKKHLSKQSKFILVLSKYSFGAYLVHYEVIRVVRFCGLDTLSFNPVFSVPAIAIITFIFSFIISAVLNQIPLLKKYIV